MAGELAQALLDHVWLWTSLVGIAVGALTFGAAATGSSFAPILVMLTVPLQRTVLVGEGGLHLTWTQVALAGFFGGALFRLVEGKLRIPVDVVTIAALAVISVYGMSVMVIDDLSPWAGETYRWTVAMLFLIAARAYVAQRDAGRRLLIALAATGVTAGAIGVWQALANVGPESFERSGLTRAYGAFGEPNPFGAFAVMIALPSIAAIFCVRGVPARWPVVTASVAGGAALIAILTTQSRGAGAGLFAGLITLGALYLVGSRYAYRVAAVPGAATVSVLVIIAVAEMIGGTEGNAEVTTANWAERERRAHWGAAAEMLVSNPVLGVGAGGFNDEFRGETTEWRFRISQGHAHSAYLQVAAETGIAGLVAYLALLGLVVWRLIYRINTVPEHWLAWGALAVTTAVVVHGIFDYLHVLSLGIVLSGIWAFGLAAAPRGVVPRDHNSTD